MKGIEGEQSDITAKKWGGVEASRSVLIKGTHHKLLQVELVDETDSHNQLVHVKEWLLHPRELPLHLEGNVFVIENALTASGPIAVKTAPLPRVRRDGQPLVDLSVGRGADGGIELTLHQTGPDDLEAWHILEYEGGREGRIRAMHRWQRSLRPDTDVHRIPRFVSNTWGDRNRDARIRHDFIMEEINAAASLGVDVVQIDDGWQKGVSSNSSKAKSAGGVWSGFWATDPEFWTPDPKRFPNGFSEITKHAARNGVEIGLWYAPDSSNEFANWKQDALQLLRLYREYGVRTFKLDSIDAASHAARRNLRCMLEEVRSESGGQIVCDLDITGSNVSRPGYFGAIGCGPLFVENRYTDWHCYWPHSVLRNLWQLSHWVAPQNMRMEFLNNERNGHKYQEDPLAPAAYPPATLFAIIMFSNPLGWFENTGLSAKFRESVTSLVRCWRLHRAAIATGDIYPIGDTPDGMAWTGFCSVADDKHHGFAVAFNEMSGEQKHTFVMPASFETVTRLHGEGSVSINGKELTVQIPKVFGYVFVMLS
jgi:alpha-galactosidase